MDFITNLIKPPAKEHKAKEDILFDVSEFKANKHQKIAQEARRILTILPQYRQESEVHYVSKVQTTQCNACQYLPVVSVLFGRSSLMSKDEIICFLNL